MQDLATVSIVQSRSTHVGALVRGIQSFHDHRLFSNSANVPMTLCLDWFKAETRDESQVADEDELVQEKHEGRA